MWRYRTPGIPDSMFARSEGVPITKEEIRAVQISKARISEGDTIYDIGCGSGSISVEAAIQAGREGVVLAVDRDPHAIRTTQQNCARFGLPNIRTFTGDALFTIPSLPEPDVILIGGTGGQTPAILEMCAGRLRPGGRIVIGIILIETLDSVLHTIQDMRLQDVDITQITILKSRHTSAGTMMLARNPVTVVSASGTGLSGGSSRQGDDL